jgi:hypothetical protein
MKRKVTVRKRLWPIFNVTAKMPRRTEDKYEITSVGTVSGPDIF